METPGGHTHSGSRGFQQVQRRECQWTAVQMDIGLRLKNVSNIVNIIMIFSLSVLI